MIQIRCGCGRQIKVKESSAGKKVRCPDCDMRLQVPASAPPAVRQSQHAELVEATPRKRKARGDVHVSVQQPSQVTNSLGVGSIVLGILAFLICWIPVVGLIGLPLSLLGVVLAGVGCVMAAMRGGTGVGYPIAGMAVSGLAAAVTLTITFVLGSAAVETAKVIEKAAKKAEQRANDRASNAVAAKAATPGASPSAENAKDADSAKGPRWVGGDQPATIGNVTYTVQATEIGQVSLTKLGRATASSEELLRIEIGLANNTKNRKLNFISYDNARIALLGFDSPRLKDNFDNTYKRIDFGFGTQPTGQVDQTDSIYPQKSITEVLVFETPLETATSLYLTLPAEYVIDETGLVRFEIPANLIRRAGAEVVARPTPKVPPEEEPVAETKADVAETKAVESTPEPEEPPTITKEERAEKQAALKLQLAERFQKSDPRKAADYARSAIKLAPSGSETARKAQRLLDKLDK